MSRVMLGYDANPNPDSVNDLATDYRSQYDGGGSPSPFAINLPPQYQAQVESSMHFPDPADIRRPFEALSDDQAVRIVRADYESAMAYRYQNHDWRWTIADTLYTGWKQTRYWEGTKIPMANVSVMTDFDQIESAMPRIMEGLFGEPEWFEATAYGRTTPVAARHVRDYMLEQLGEQRPREICRRMIKSSVMYGNGILAVGWQHQARQSLRFTPQFIPRQRQVINPIDNVMNNIRSASEFDRRVVETLVEDYINRPIWRYIPLRKFFVDPNAPSPMPVESRYCGWENWMHIDELDILRDTPGFESMPDLYTLYQISQFVRLHTQADTGQSEQEAIRRSSWTPSIDQSSDPAAARIKVIFYHTADREIWSLNNQYVVYNKPSKIGRITFHDAFYADMQDRFYAMAISDVVEPEQRTQEGLLNARLNEISLAIHPTTVKQRGSGTPIYQVRVRPGAVAESSDPKNDVIRQYPMNVTQHAHLEQQASELRVQKHTGVTDIGMVGVGSPNNPGARTATGAGLQGQASAFRIIYVVENCEDTVIAPALQDTHDFNQRFLDPNQMLDAAGGGQLDPIVIFGAKVKFGMRAASRMQSRQALITLMPMTLQALLNPNLLAQLAAMGQTVDFVEMMQMFMDASGYRQKFNWIRPLTEQEMKMMQKPDQGEIDMALQQDRMMRLREMQLNKQEMEILRDMINIKMEALLNPEPKKVGEGKGSR